MEELAALKAKYAKINTSELKDSLLSQAKRFDTIKVQQAQRLDEDESKIEELMSKLTVMKETLCKENGILKHKTDELSKHNAYLEKFEAEKTKVLYDIKQLEAKQENLKSMKPNAYDQQVLEQGKRKLRLYKNLTRIHWDYQDTKSSIKGYVSNKCDYIHHFCYKNQELDEKLIDSLWHEIYLSCNESSQVHKENVQSDIATNMDIKCK